MKERPILFSSEMVRAILAGTKTQTRRLYRPRSVDNIEHVNGPLWSLPSPYGSPGDYLWVREAFTHITGNGIRVHYRADGEPTDSEGRVLPTEAGLPRWRPSIFMRRQESRITLEITEVRVQRLQEISEDDIESEGVTDEDTRCEGECGATPCMLLRPTFQRIWDRINGKRAAWSSNPWVWAIGFRRLKP